MNGDPIIVAENIHKSFGAVSALRGVDLNVERGKVLGLLGPNGAGKTTLIRILTTLMSADSGTASIEGFDVVHDATTVRQIIGLTGQYAAVDENLTGRENLIMVARLYHHSMRESSSRAADLLERFGLTDAADRPLKTYSGGMRRRLDIALSLVNRPPVLFLDEPTTGLDPQSRLALWGIIRELVSQGTTVLLTTQYLDEADYLADRIVVIDHGKIIASGTPKELKAQVSADMLEFRVIDAKREIEAAEMLKPFAQGDITVDTTLHALSVPLIPESGAVQKALRTLDIASIAITDLALRHPTLDEVFLKLTGSKTSV